MATKKTGAPKKAQKSAQPDIITGASLEVEAGTDTPKTEETVKAPETVVAPAAVPVPEEPAVPEWQKVLEDNYGHIIRNRDQTALLTAILTELVKIRVR